MSMKKIKKSFFRKICHKANFFGVFEKEKDRMNNASTTPSVPSMGTDQSIYGH